MKGHLCPCTCGEIHQTHWCTYCWSESLAIKQDCSSSFSGSAVSGDRWFAPGLESVVEQHLPWTLKPCKALYGSPGDVWGIFCVLLVAQVASNYFISPKKFFFSWKCVCVPYRQIAKFKSKKLFCIYITAQLLISVVVFPSKLKMQFLY